MTTSVNYANEGNTAEGYRILQDIRWNSGQYDERICSEFVPMCSI